jgi:hypothetical protein
MAAHLSATGVTLAQVFVAARLVADRARNLDRERNDIGWHGTGIPPDTIVPPRIVSDNPANVPVNTVPTE